MTENKIKKANDILDKFEFFNQRAGRELWSDKPKDIQDKDIKNFSNDVKFLKDLINRQKAEIERLQTEHDKNFEKWQILDRRTKERYAELYEVAKGVVRAEAIKEFAERLKETELYEFIEEYFENAELCYEVRHDQFYEHIDNLVKEMVGE